MNVGDAMNRDKVGDAVNISYAVAFSADHSGPEGLHFPCMIVHGYPGPCTAACFPFALIAHLRSSDTITCWDINVPDGVDGRTGFVVDYSYIEWKYSVMFDNGEVYKIHLVGGTRYDIVLSILPFFLSRVCACAQWTSAGARVTPAKLLLRAHAAFNPCLWQRQSFSACCWQQLCIAVFAPLVRAQLGACWRAHCIP